MTCRRLPTPRDYMFVICLVVLRPLVVLKVYLRGPLGGLPQARLPGGGPALVFLGTKTDLDPVAQVFAETPEAFCASRRLAPPLAVAAEDPDAAQMVAAINRTIVERIVQK